MTDSNNNEGKASPLPKGVRVRALEWLLAGLTLSLLAGLWGWWGTGSTPVAGRFTQEQWLLLSTGLLLALISALWLAVRFWRKWKDRCEFIASDERRWLGIERARSQARMICSCSTIGEIMNLHHCVTHPGMEVIACPLCGNVRVLQPAGQVSISREIVFRPPLPVRALNHWLTETERNSSLPSQPDASEPLRRASEAPGEA